MSLTEIFNEVREGTIKKAIENKDMEALIKLILMENGMLKKTFEMMIEEKPSDEVKFFSLYLGPVNNIEALSNALLEIITEN